MSRSRAGFTATSLFRVSRRTLRMRLALLYGGLFLASGCGLLALTNVLLLHGTVDRAAPVRAGSVSPTGSAIAIQHSGTNIHQLLMYSGVALAVMAVLSLPLGWLVAGRVLQPFRTIITTARDISASNLHERLGLDSPYDEFKELGATLDDLFGRIETSVESQKHFVANAAHELRTPLTAERTLLQVALADPDADAQTLRATCEELLTLGDQQERLIEALLTLASSEQGVERWEPFDLADVAENVVLDRRRAAERRGIHVDATLTAAPAAGDPSLAEILVANLVDNALRHNVAGGRVAIVSTTTAGRATISVQNTGPVIPADKVDRLFQPFRRLGDGRTRHADGHGLGLAIVRAIASAHGARLAARAQSEGGLVIEVTFAEDEPPA